MQVDFDFIHPFIYTFLTSTCNGSLAMQSFSGVYYQVKIINYTYQQYSVDSWTWRSSIATFSNITHSAFTTPTLRNNHTSHLFNTNTNYSPALCPMRIRLITISVKKNNFISIYLYLTLYKDHFKNYFIISLFQC